MVGPQYDCQANPLGAVRLTFEKALASGLDPASFDGKDWGALDLFRQFLFDQGALSHVPCTRFSKTLHFLLLFLNSLH